MSTTPFKNCCLYPDWRIHFIHGPERILSFDKLDIWQAVATGVISEVKGVCRLFLLCSPGSKDRQLELKKDEPGWYDIILLVDKALSRFSSTKHGRTILPFTRMTSADH